MAQARRGGDRGRAGVRHLLEYAMLRAVLALLAPLGWDGARRLGRVLGSFAFSVLRIRRRVALENLAHAFPDWPEERRVATAAECYRQFGITFLELCLLPRKSREEIYSRTRLEHPEYFQEALRAGSGAVLVTGHFGNWELTGAAVAGTVQTTWVLVGPQRNRRVDAYVTRAREAAGMRVLPTDRALLGVPRALRRNEFVAILVDQDAGRRGVFLPFLGRAASTPLGPVRFARRAGAPLILGFGRRLEDGRYLLEMPPPIRLREDLAPEEAEVEALGRALQELEAMIRRYPEQWFWMHRRWKTRPPAEASGQTGLPVRQGAAGDGIRVPGGRPERQPVECRGRSRKQRKGGKGGEP